MASQELEVIIQEMRSGPKLADLVPCAGHALARGSGGEDAEGSVDAAATDDFKKRKKRHLTRTRVSANEGG